MEEHPVSSKVKSTWPRTLIRVLLAVVIAVGLFSWWASNVGRGFLEARRGLLFLEGQRELDGRWVFSKVGTGDEDAPDPPWTASSSFMQIRLQASSMGRTDLGEWSSWRASHWLVTSISSDGDDVWIFGDDPSLLDEGMVSALDEFMLVTIIPHSDEVGIWPKVPPHSVSRHASVLWWTARQRRMSIVKFTAVVTTCVMLGVVISCALVPRRRKE